MPTLIRVIINGLALWVASVLLSGMTLAETSTTTSSKIITVLIVGAIFGLVNALVRPILRFFGFPLIVLTLGLFLFIINAAMLLLTSKLAGVFNLDFHVDQFWPTAVLGALIVSVVSWLLGLFFDDDGPRQPRRQPTYRQPAEDYRDGPRLSQH